MYGGHAVSLRWKSTRDVVADEPHSDSQGLHREKLAEAVVSPALKWVWLKGWTT